MVKRKVACFMLFCVSSLCLSSDAQELSKAETKGTSPQEGTEELLRRMRTEMAALLIESGTTESLREAPQKASVVDSPKEDCRAALLASALFTVDWLLRVGWLL